MMRSNTFNYAFEQFAVADWPLAGSALRAGECTMIFIHCGA